MNSIRLRIKRFFVQDFVVWPEGSPEKAVHAKGYPLLWWYLVGPLGYWAMFNRKRMTQYDGPPHPEGVIHTAALLERWCRPTSPDKRS